MKDYLGYVPLTTLLIFYILQIDNRQKEVKSRFWHFENGIGILHTFAGEMKKRQLEPKNTVMGKRRSFAEKQGSEEVLET